jgi:NTP pyrophosphatase (non-canonical NTP hydrolase)
METTVFDRLTELQKKVGYTEGEINPIAILGLVGEAGEVLSELTSIVQEQNKIDVNIIGSAISIAGLVDDLKKKVRDEKKPVQFLLPLMNENSFDEEMGDVLYYLNALAINRGQTLAYYAELSYKKVSAKVQINIAKS